MLFKKQDNKAIKLWFATLTIIGSALLLVKPLNQWVTDLTGTNWIQFIVAGVTLLLAGAIIFRKPKMKWMWFTILGIYVAVWHANPSMWSFIPNMINYIISLVAIVLGAWCIFGKK